MKKTFFTIFILVLILLGGFRFVLAQEKPQVEIKFFYSRTCPHCDKEKEFLEGLEQKYQEIIIKRYEISAKESIELLKNFYQEYEVPEQEWGLVPITFTGERYFLGFNENIAKDLESCIKECILQEDKKEEGGKKIYLPIIGQIDISKYSFSVLAVLLGFLDGFNVCSLGALVLILGLVLVLRSRQKIILFGGLFILTSVLVYGLLIVLWYQLFSLLAPYVRIMEFLIGTLGVGGGIYFLKQFIKYRKYGPACDVQPGQKVASKFSKKFQDSFQNKNVLAISGLVLLFAVVITIVEFPCSAVIPVIFAGVLSKAQLSVLTYIFYIAIFLLFYMLDEIIVFLVAVFKMTVWLSSGKFVTWITLIEAVALFLLGIYYLIGIF